MSAIKRPGFPLGVAPANAREATLEGAARSLVSAAHEYAHCLLARIDAGDTTVPHDANDIARCLRFFDQVAADPPRWYRALGLLPPLMRPVPLLSSSISLFVSGFTVLSESSEDAVGAALGMFGLPILLRIQEAISPLRTEMCGFGYDALTYRANRIMAEAEGKDEYVDPDLAMDAHRVLAHRSLMQPV